MNAFVDKRELFDADANLVCKHLYFPAEDITPDNPPIVHYQEIETGETEYKFKDAPGLLALTTPSRDIHSGYACVTAENQRVKQYLRLYTTGAIEVFEHRHYLNKSWKLRVQPKPTEEIQVWRQDYRAGVPIGPERVVRPEELKLRGDPVAFAVHASDRIFRHLWDSLRLTQ